MPKAIPTIMKTFVHKKLSKTQLKTDCMIFGKNMEECFKVKNYNFIVWHEIT